MGSDQSPAGGDTGGTVQVLPAARGRRRATCSLESTAEVRAQPSRGVADSAAIGRAYTFTIKSYLYICGDI